MTTKFRLLAEADTPTIVGKAWWNEALKLSAAGDQRRLVLGALGAFAAVGIVLPAGIGMLADDDNGTERRPALTLQRRHGWSFGAADEATSLTLPERSGVVDPAVLARLADDLAPRAPALVPMYVPTLFQAIGSRPAYDAPPTEDAAAGFLPLEAVIAPIDTAAMRAARASAARLRVLLGGPAALDTAGLAVIVDLPGAAAVAFAGALADAFDPVFLFDNWPHPRGVVPAHLTLAAALTERQRLVDGRGTRSPLAPPLFVLDRERLSPYVDDENQFDNRWTARLPAADQLKALGITWVLYVAPNGAAPVESDDVVDDLVAWTAAGIAVRALQIADFDDASSDAAARAAFVARYDRPATADGGGGTEGASGAASARVVPTTTSSWRPLPRATAFSSPTASSTPLHPLPPGFGHVPVVVSSSGTLLGAQLYRRGSWHRTTSYFGGG